MSWEISATTFLLLVLMLLLMLLEWLPLALAELKEALLFLAKLVALDGGFALFEVGPGGVVAEDALATWFPPRALWMVAVMTDEHALGDLCRCET